MSNLTPLADTQAFYDLVREFFNRPTARIAMEDGYCVYRGEQDAKSDLRCAFGCAIPDELYQPEFENRKASSLLTEAVDPRTGSLIDTTELKAYFANVSMEFISEVQSLHDMQDGEGDVAWFIRQLDLLASEKHGLTVAA